MRVLIVEEPCVLYARRTLKKARTQTAYVAEQGADVLLCHEKLLVAPPLPKKAARWLLIRKCVQAVWFACK